MNKIKENIIPISILLIGAVVALFIFYGGGESGNIKGNGSAEEVGSKVVGFVNDYLLQGQASVSLNSVSEEYGLYKIKLELEGNEIDSYATKDGKLFFPDAMDMNEIMGLVQQPTAGQPVQQQPVEPITGNVPENINEFVACLADNGFKLYGADWCPYCQQVVDMFGGYDVVGPIYVECTENEDLCRQEGISGYPTIRVNGVDYTGQRTLEGFGAKTNCLL